MVFYAHTRSGQPEAAWEVLSDHLAEVGAAASSHGARFGAAELGRMAGLLHDLGKYGADFQARLHDPRVRADHSTAGALWATTHLPPKWGRLLAHAVAGHHAGLQDGLFGAEGRLEAKKALLAPVERAARLDGLVLPHSVCAPAGLKLSNTHGFQMAFLTRMIFSCLIDADRMAAAAFDADGDEEGATDHPSILQLDMALHDFVGKRSAPASALNALRDGVLRGAI